VVSTPAAWKQHGLLAGVTAVLLIVSVAVGIVVGRKLKVHQGTRVSRSGRFVSRTDRPVTLRRLDPPSELVGTAERDDAIARPPLILPARPAPQAGTAPPRLLVKVATTDRGWHEPDEPDRRLRSWLGWPMRWHREGHAASLDAGWAVGTKGIQ
jgi:hypothetical protein